MLGWVHIILQLSVILCMNISRLANAALPNCDCCTPSDTKYHDTYTIYIDHIYTENPLVTVHIQGEKYQQNEFRIKNDCFCFKAH